MTNTRVLWYMLILRLHMALELAKHNPVYEDIASKFFEVRGSIPAGVHI